MAELLWVLSGLVALLAATGLACQRLHLPPALGYLLVGVVLPEGVTDARLQEVVHLEEAAHIAVLVLLFFIGLELDVRSLRKVLRDTRIVSVFNILVPGLLGAGLGRLLGWPIEQAVVLGIAISLSSTIFGERLSAGRGFPTVARQRMFGVLLAEDVAAGALLALIAVIAGGTAGASWLDAVQSIGVLLAALFVLAGVALLAVPRILDRVAVFHAQELTILASGAFLLLFSAAGQWAGSAELGAFLAGMATAEAASRFAVRTALSGLRSISLAIFFFASGLTVDPLVALSHWPLVLACIVVVAVAKVVVHVPAALARGLSVEDSLRVAFGLSTVGEFSLILLAAAHAGGIAHPALSAAVTGSIVGLLVVSPLLMLSVPWLGNRLRHLPRGVGRPVQAMLQGVRREKAPQPGASARRRARGRGLAAAFLVAAVYGLAAAAYTWLPARLPHLAPVWVATLVFGFATAVAIPFAYQLYRGYRAFMRGLFSVPDPPRRVDQLKMRFADALLALLLLLLAVPLAVALGASLPVVGGSLLLAAAAAVAGWRQLAQLTANLEGTVARVLGSGADAPVLLDRAIDMYGWDFRVAALSLPADSTLLGQTLGDVRLRERTGATIAILKRGSREVVNPPPRERFQFGDTVVLLGDPGQLARAEALLEAGEAPLRMAAESRSASVADVAVEAGSWLSLAPRPRDEVERRTGVSLLGEWPQGRDHPVPWDDARPPAPGDRVIVLGTPMQIERLRSLATVAVDGPETEVTALPDPA